MQLFDASIDAVDRAQDLGQVLFPEAPSMPQYQECIDFKILCDDSVGATQRWWFAKTTISGLTADYPPDHGPISIFIDPMRS